jgi:serine/threonine-protein kinase HipA
VNDLAVLAGLNVAESRFEKFSGKSCFLSKRFDRVTKDGITNRIHFSSAMTQLARTDGDSSDASYLDIVEFLRSNSSEPQKDLEELWKRIVFNIAVSNTDDHLRNHGFLLTGRGWKLSPLYDITPNPDKDNLSLCITQTDNSKDMQLALATAKYYGISDVRAEKEVARIKAIVDEKWRATAAKYGISRAEMERMRGAFEEK